jgi:YD repeat-containing protein
LHVEGGFVIDTGHWQLRGPVRTMRSEIAEWDAGRADWGPARFVNDVRFDEDGRLLQLDQRGENDSVHRTTYSYDEWKRLVDKQFGTAGAAAGHRVIHSYDPHDRLLRVTHLDPDGTEHVTETCTYDEQGRRTTVHDLPLNVDGHGIEGSELFYGAPGAVRQTTKYDERDLAVESAFHDASGVVIRRVVLTRDAAGRVLNEEAQNVGAFPLPDRPEMSAEDREKMASLFALAFGSIRTTYTYDAEGRVLERTLQMGLLSEERTTHSYDDRGHQIAQLQESVSREMGFDDEGRPQPSADTKRMHETRFEYQLDGQGNWTERIVSSRFAEGAELQPSNVERRSIDYYQR